jgi:hypothetical protein
LFFTGDGNAGNKVRQRLTDPGRRFYCQMPSLFPGERFRHISDHLPLRRARNKVRNLLLQRLIPGGNLRF